MPENRSLDVLGIQPFAKSVEILTQGIVDGAGAFLGRICLPAAEELGLLFQEKIRSFRGRNAVIVVSAAEKIQIEQGITDNVYVHPRIANQILDQGSWADEPEMQIMWAGLLASACTPDGKDQSNKSFSGILSELTPHQVRILNHICKNNKKMITASGLVITEYKNFSFAELLELSGHTDINSLDVEVDRLRDLGLVGPTSGLSIDTHSANLNVTSIGLNLYIRCQGTRQSPENYFGPLDAADPTIIPTSILV
jgi:hypothetical protein